MMSAGESIEAMVNAVKQTFEDMKAGKFADVAQDD